MLLEDANVPRKRGYEPHVIGFSDMRTQGSRKPDMSRRGVSSGQAISIITELPKRDRQPEISPRKIGRAADLS